MTSQFNVTNEDIANIYVSWELSSNFLFFLFADQANETADTFVKVQNPGRLLASPYLHKYLFINCFAFNLVFADKSILKF